MVNRLLCRLFGHRWSSWFGGDGSMVTICSRCDLADVEPPDDVWQDYYPGELGDLP